MVLPRMVFSATSLGLFLYLRFCFIFFIPRVAGSLRTVRWSASDPKLKSPDPSPDSLSTSTPGLFLGLEIPRNTSLITVYGRTRTGASLYGICLECNGMFETVSASLSTSDQGPTCLFSLALNGHTDNLLELHNLYDPRFGTYGEISLSFVEYAINDDGDSSAPAAPMQICKHHLHWPPHDKVLLRRDATSGSTSSITTSTPTQDCQKGHLSGQMDTMIGLIAALITLTVLIFIVVALYVLFRHRLYRLKEDPEGKLGDLSRSSQRNISGTLVSHTGTTNPEAHSKYIADLPPKDRYIPDQQETYLSDPTSSFSTHVDLAQTGNFHQPPRTNTSPVTNRRAPSRPRANPPPFDPPNEPVPELPKISQPLPIRRPNGSPLPSVSAQNKSQRPPYRADGALVQGVGRLSSNTGVNTPESSTQTHKLNQSSSDLSLVSHEGRLKTRPPSKALPVVPTFSPTPSSLLFKSTPVQVYGHLTQNSQEQIEVPIRMETIPESNRSSDLGKTSPSTLIPTITTQENVRSSSNRLQGGLAQPRTPQEFGSISLPSGLGDVRRVRELGHAYPPEPLRGEIRESAVMRRSLKKLSIDIPVDPEDWLTLPVTNPFPGSTEGRPNTDVKKLSAQRRSSDLKVQPLRYTTSGKKVTARWSHLPKDQRPTRGREMGLSAKVTVVAPLSPHKRALPKIPT